MHNTRKIWKSLLSGFGSGFLPIAPGTWGSALAVLMMWPLVGLPNMWQNLILTVLILSFFWIGVLGSNLLQDEWGKDPSQTVIDEMVGLWITMLGFPITWPYLLAAFLLFRAFDIAKPWGIRKMEDLPGGWGVMLDDVMAGVYANLVMQVGVFLLLAFGN